MVSQYWRLEVQTPGVNSAVLPLKPSGESFLASSWGFAGTLGHSLACRCVTPPLDASVFILCSACVSSRCVPSVFVSLYVQIPPFIKNKFIGEY